MRVAGRAAAAAIVALIASLAVSWVGAAWLRSVTPEAGLLWRIAPPSKVAIWTLGGAHGASLHLEAGAEVDERIGRIGERIGDRLGGLLGREDGLIPGTGEDEGLGAPRADLDVRMASLTVLGIAALAMALVARSSGVRGLRDAAATAGVGGAVYGAGVGILVAGSAAELGFDARIVSAGVEATMSPLIAGALGVAWGAVFAFIGALCAPGVVDEISAFWRAVGAGLKRAAAVGAIAAVGCLIVLAIAQGGGGAGGGLDPSLAALGVVLLGINIVGAAIVLAHGATMNIALDAGPLNEWTQLGYSSQGAQSLSPARWTFLLVPLLAGIAAGHVMRKRITASDVPRVAVAFGAAWGIALALIAMLVRVRVLSSFSLTALEAGGGASINPAVALALSAVWGGVMSYVGMVATSPSARTVAAAQPRVAVEDRSVSPPAAVISATPALEPITASPAPRRCGVCGASVPDGDRFCGACGRPM